MNNPAPDSRIRSIRPFDRGVAPMSEVFLTRRFAGIPAREHRRRIEISVVMARQVSSIDSEGRPSGSERRRDLGVALWQLRFS
jgi:hypothetical protein